MTFVYIAELMNHQLEDEKIPENIEKTKKTSNAMLHKKSKLVEENSKPSLVFQEEVIPSREQLVARSFKRIFWPAAYLLSI